MPKAKGSKAERDSAAWMKERYFRPGVLERGIKIIAEARAEAEEKKAEAERSLVIWDRYLEQKEHCHRLTGSREQEERCGGEYDVLFSIEHVLQDAIGKSVHALAAVLMIEIEDNDNKDIPGLYQAALSAIRPQLIGSIAEYADRTLAQKTEGART